jgi:cysteine desulfurase
MYNFTTTTGKRQIYMDYAASTPVDPRVLEAMLPYFSQTYGNASGLHSQARASARAMDEARQTVAEILGCTPREVIFTGCGSESDNLALRGVAFAQRDKGKGAHIITSPIEHHAVSHTVDQLVEKFGFEATIVPVDEYGLVDPEAVREAIRDDTILISIMYANNEVGTIEPVAEIGEIAREKGIPFHTDAVQAGGALDLNVDRLKVDLLSLSGHKFYAPKGVGVLYVRKGTPLLPMQTGGGHEGGRRAGTENVPYIVGLAEALRLAYEECEREQARLSALRDELIAGVTARIPESRLTGHPRQRLPNNASFVIRGVEAESLLMNLDLAGVCAASGSACTSGMPEPSHVLVAMGVPHDWALGALRLTLGRFTTRDDIRYILEVLPEIVERLRAISPVYV